MTGKTILVLMATLSLISCDSDFRQGDCEEGFFQQSDGNGGFFCVPITEEEGLDGRVADNDFTEETN